MRGVLIDGVIASGKTSVLSALQRQMAGKSPLRSSIVLTEHYTERMTEHLRIDDELEGRLAQAHVDEILGGFSSFERMFKNSNFAEERTHVEMVVLLERLILTFLSSAEVRNYDLKVAAVQFSMLSELGFKQVILVVPPRVLSDRIFSTLKYRGECWRQYLYSRGSVDQIVQYYLDWQTKCIHYAEMFKDRIDTVVIESSQLDYDQCASDILNGISI